MPMYEYGCKQCGKQTEVLQKMSDAPLTTCPDCGGTLERLISQTSFVLKGGGWYKDGYGSTPAAGSSASSSSSTSAKPTTSASSESPTTHSRSGGCCDGGACKSKPPKTS
ncbi:MAG: zinc ribbon domain-containing protein [Deltaproteobacteria bacterium]|nr:zinc ribbon domain-containing protein [Deltaproteobacteria bacterium]